MNDHQHRMSVTAFQVDIVKAVREAFDQLRFQYDGTYRVWVPWQKDPLEEGRTGWTKAINTTLCRIGREHFGMGVGTRTGKVVAGTHLDYGEWLWDVSWCREDNQGRMVDMPLVAECELTNTIGHIFEDFQKLLVARAGVRLMIHEQFTNRDQPPGRFPGDTFPGNNDDRAAWMAGHLAGHIRAFGRTQRDDVYLLAALQWDSDTAAEYRFRYFCLNTDGTTIEWVEKEPCPLVANAPWVVFPEDLLSDTQNDLAKGDEIMEHRDISNKALRVLSDILVEMAGEENFDEHWNRENQKLEWNCQDGKWTKDSPEGTEWYRQNLAVESARSDRDKAVTLMSEPYFELSFCRRGQGRPFLVSLMLWNDAEGAYFVRHDWHRETLKNIARNLRE